MEDGSWMVTNFLFSFPPHHNFFRFYEAGDNLIFISSTVFNVTDHDGKKITDEGILNFIQKVSPFNWVKFLHLLLN